MDSNKGLIIGIDLQEDISMVSWYDKKNRTPANVVFENDEMYTDNPVPVSSWADIMDGGIYSEADDLISHIAFLIESAKRRAGETKVLRICFTLESFSQDVADALKKMMPRMGYDASDWSVISHEEAFAYYAYNQRREIYAKGVMLLDYGKSGIAGYLMMDARLDGNEIIMENPYKLDSDIINKAYTNTADIAEAEPQIMEWLTPIVEDYPVSCIFLTGKGFDVDKLSDEFTRFICSKRKVFAGQNIYVKGACHCGVEEIYEGRFNKVILACNNRITTGIETDILDRGILKRLRIVKPGTNWYMAYREYDFILEDTNKFIIHMRPCNRKQEYTEVIDISDIPYRKDKLTRVTVSFSWKSHNSVVIEIKDRGFGDFIKSSGRTVVKELDLSGDKL